VKGEVRDFTPNGVLELWRNGFGRTIFDRLLLLPNIPTLQHSNTPFLHRHLLLMA
jgi:hypothetical protein